MASKTKISALTNGPALTPVRKRRNRPSHSPLKSTLETPGLKHAKSITFPGSKGLNPEKPYHLPTSAVEFVEASFIGSDGKISSDNMSWEQQQEMGLYLAEHYNAEEISVRSPFLIVGCKGDPPAEDKRPFTIAGMVVIWRRSDDMEVFPIVGASGRDKEVDIGSHQASQLLVQQIPPEEIILYLANHIFTDCKAIAFLWHTIVIELPEMSREDFIKRLTAMPSKIKGSQAIIRFHNGPLPGTEMAQRVVAPNAREIDGIDDKTDYVSSQGKFYPGTMIGSLSQKRDLYKLVTAGILIERGLEQRLTCAFHCWQDHDKKYPDVLGNTHEEAQRLFAVQQGHNPGSIVGFVRERIGNSDIGLVQLQQGVAFENEFMESFHRPKQMVRAKSQKLGDEYVFNAYCTGLQKLMGFGYRWSIGRSAHEPSTTAFIELEQSAYLSSAPVIDKPPMIRNGVCGAVLLKSSDTNRLADNADTVMARGEIAGMMRLVDFKNPDPNSVSSYLCYAETFDRLVDAGWKVTQLSEDEVVFSGSPSKKQKIQH